jgi:cell division septum initiation protein DivIVA
MAELDAVLDALTDLVTGARSMPLSGSCVVHRDEVLGLVEELRELLPVEVAQARALLDTREEVLGRAREEGDAIVAAAHEERARLVARSEVVAEAYRQADAIVTDAQARADDLRAEADDYVDSKLASFEVVLGRTLATVERGRARLSGRDPFSELADERAGAAQGPGPAHGPRE